MVSPIIQMISNKHSGISGLATQLMVLHSGECPLRGGYAQSLTNWAGVPISQGGPEASWHWFVDPIAIVQMVLPEFYAWHASEANAMSEGFEQAGYARLTRAEWTTPEGMKQLDNLAWIMAQRAMALGIPPRWLTTDEVEAVTKRGNRSIKGFCLHRQIDPETRTDPGNGYPYDLLMEQIKFYMSGGITSTEKEDDMYTDKDRAVDQRVLSLLESLEEPLHAKLLRVPRWFKGDKSDQIWELEGGKLRYVSGLEWNLLGRPEPTIAAQADIDAMPKEA